MSPEPRPIPERLDEARRTSVPGVVDQAEVQRRTDAVSHAAMIVRENEARARRRAWVVGGVVTALVFAVTVLSC